jgi:tRNA uridine 5-carboxymethylaminomethyl modification enzyme
MKKDYDVIVIGGGHAGCEAALAAARMGCNVLLATINLDTIAQMSCNPAIGGLAKGQIVREIDALGGEMAKNIDATGIQFRMLNKKKGPAVWAVRAQADKKKYQERMKYVLEACRSVDLKQELVTALRIGRDGGLNGITCLSGNEYRGAALIITTGTFLNGMIHIGGTTISSGRAGECASVALGEFLRAQGFITGRLKTGTPPRINGKDIDFELMHRQEGDDPPPVFSHCTAFLSREQIPCHITHTNERTRRIILDNIQRSPLYGGKITGTGVRYCPSVEDKIMKFPDKAGHQVFIEPEGTDTLEMYCNGLSTSMPYDVQVALVRSIKGLEHAQIMRPGYAIEYDYIHPTQLKPTLESKGMEHVYFAGQINGTSGYEEAAAQGLIAGINAVLKIKGQPPFIPGRDEAYIGVLVDDLVTKGTVEPYRMFTSRAEFRLLLRHDNADMRLMRYGHSFGLITGELYDKVKAKEHSIREGIDHLSTVRLDGQTAQRLLKRHNVSYRMLVRDAGGRLKDYDDEVVRGIEIEVKYEGYIGRQRDEVIKMKDRERKVLPATIAYRLITGLKKEAREKLESVRPRTLGQASRIAGITPADISVLRVWLESRKKRVPRGTRPEKTRVTP